LRLQNKDGLARLRRFAAMAGKAKFSSAAETAKMWIENLKTIVPTAEKNYFSRTEHSFAVAARRKI